MFVNAYPNFNIGRILKKEMFENLKTYPRDFVDRQFEEYSDGIIAGTEVVPEDEFIVITEGIIKHEKRVYMLTEKYEIPYYETERETLIKVRFLDKTYNDDFQMYCSEIFLDEDLELKRDEIELGRFKLRKGAKLKANYYSFLDLGEEYNRINLINIQYSALGDSTISPIILDYFCRELREFKTKDHYDMAFLMEHMKHRVINREAIVNYICCRLDMDNIEGSNKSIYRYLSKILKEAKNEARGAAEMRRQGQRRIIID